MNRRPAQIVLALIALTSIGISINFEINRQRSSHGTASLSRPYEQWDHFIQEAAPRQGVFLKFLGFSGPDRGYIANIYYRAVYVAYPKPVMVADPSVTVNNENSLIDTNSYPNDLWLTRHGVGSVFTIAYDPTLRGPIPLDLRWVGQNSGGEPK